MNKKLMILSFCLITFLSLTIVSANDTNDTQTQDDIASQSNEYSVTNSKELNSVMTSLNGVKDNSTSSINLKKETYKTDLNWNNKLDLNINANNSELFNSTLAVGKNSKLKIDSIILNDTSIINEGNLVIANSILTSEESKVSISNKGHLSFENCIFRKFRIDALEIYNNDYMFMDNCTFENIFRIYTVIENNGILVINNSEFTTGCDITSTSDPLIANQAKLLINNSIFNDELNSFISDYNNYESEDYTYSEVVIVNSTLNQYISQYAYTNYISNVKVTIVNSTFNSITKAVDGLSSNTEEVDYKESYAKISGENINLIGNNFNHSRINLKPYRNSGCNIVFDNNTRDYDTITAPSGKKFNMTDVFDVNNNTTITNSDNTNQQDIAYYISTFLNGKSESIKTEQTVLNYNVAVNDEQAEVKDVQFSEEAGGRIFDVPITSVKRVKVNADDEVLLEMILTDSNSIPLANKNIVLLHNYANQDYQINLTTDNDGKCNYSFKSVYSDEKWNNDFDYDYNDFDYDYNDFDYDYNDLISIIVPNDLIITDSPRLVGSASKLVINIENINQNNSTQINDTDDADNTTENNTKPATSTTENTTNHTQKTSVDTENKKDNGLQKIVKHNIKPIKIIKQNKASENIIFLEENLNVTLQWLEEFFNKDFANKQLLIYIDDTLVYNGTVSSNSTETLFKIIKEYKGKHVLKVVEGDNVYQREFM